MRESAGIVRGAVAKDPEGVMYVTVMSAGAGFGFWTST
jgi:hypothetical protein